MSTSWNVKISELEATTNFGTNDQFVIVQDGETVKIAGNELAASIVSLTNLATRPYVDAIVDLAPETLDTLRELAQAINNDPAFAATITEAINTKITAEDWEVLWNTKNTYHLTEGSNLYFTEQRVLDVINPLLENLQVDIGDDPVFNSVTATQLNVQTVEFTGTGAVTIASGNDLNFTAVGDITFNGQTLESLAGTGPQGPQGEIGPVGPPGPQGEPGTGFVESVTDVTDQLVDDGSGTYVADLSTATELPPVIVLNSNASDPITLRLPQASTFPGKRVVVINTNFDASVQIEEDSAGALDGVVSPNTAVELISSSYSWVPITQLGTIAGGGFSAPIA